MHINTIRGEGFFFQKQKAEIELATKSVFFWGGAKPLAEQYKSGLENVR